MSSTILSDLKAVALRLGDDKVTIRKVFDSYKDIDWNFNLRLRHEIFFLIKNHDDSLRNMLANDRIISTLNESTIRGGNNFSWTDLYRSVFRYLDLEVKRTEKEMIKIGTSAPKKKNQLLEKVKQGPISLLQLVLKRGNQSKTIKLVFEKNLQFQAGFKVLINFLTNIDFVVQTLLLISTMQRRRTRCWCLR